MFNAIHLDSAYKVDVYPLRTDALARREMKERLHHRLTDGRVVPAWAICWSERSPRPPRAVNGASREGS